MCVLMSIKHYYLKGMTKFARQANVPDVQYGYPCVEVYLYLNNN